MLVRNKIKLVSSRENILLRVKEAIRIVSIIIFNIRRINLILKELKAQKNSVKRLKIDALRSLHIINAEYIIDYLKKNMTIENEQYVKNTILYYQRLILVAIKPILKN